MYNPFERYKVNMNPIAILLKMDKDGWCEKYFPEYAELFDGYPPAIKVIYYDPGHKPKDGRPMITGNTRPMELNPWEYWNGAAGEITFQGTRWAEPDDTHNGLPYQANVDEDEYLAWCHERNYFRSGNGLDPNVFIGAFDIRTSAYQARKERFKAEDLLTEPNYITCRGGVYLPARGPTRKNPWGVNSSYHPGGGAPTYISHTWGPDNRPDSEGGNHPIVWYDEARDGAKPTQAEYDMARYSVWL